MSKSSWLTKLPSPGRLATFNQQLFSLPARNRPTRLKKKFLRLTRFYDFFSLSWICVFSTFTLVATSHAISSLKKCCYEIEKNLKFMWPVWQHHYWQTCSSFNLNQTMCRDFETFHLNRQKSKKLLVVTNKMEGILVKLPWLSRQGVQPKKLKVLFVEIVEHCGAATLLLLPPLAT